TAYATIFSDARYQAWSVLGASPAFATGKIPDLFGVPYQVFETGWFDSTSTFNQAACDMYLLALPYSVAIRERVSMRSDALLYQEFQASGLQWWERLTPYIRNPRAFRRI